MNDETQGFIFLMVMLALMGVFGVVVGVQVDSAWRIAAKKHGAMEYDVQTGELKWKVLK